ncbi:MAG: DUF2605 domain-containing protein [Xenococcaceae cyanobacterium]
MQPSQSTEKELLKKILEPLLEDFQYWFSRSRSLLESEELSFLSAQEQAELMERVKKAQQEVSTAQMLFKATGGEAGIETAMLIPWHQLVAECWRVGGRLRSFNSQSSKDPDRSEPIF